MTERFPLAPHFGQTPWNEVAHSLRILPRAFRQKGQSRVWCKSESMLPSAKNVLHQSRRYSPPSSRAFIPQLRTWHCNCFRAPSVVI